MAVEVGAVVDGKVSGLAGFGAFVDLPDGKTGLVHISEVAPGYVEDIKDHLREGQEVKVRVLSVDKGGRVNLSIKKAMEGGTAPKPAAVGKSRPAGAPIKRGPKPVEKDFSKKKDVTTMTFEDKPLKFKQDSEEKIAALKRNTEGKRGGYKKA